MRDFDEANKAGEAWIDGSLASLSAMSKGVQAIALEATEYSKRSFEETGAATEKLLAATSIESAAAIQADYARAAYERFVAGSSRFTELFADLAKQTYGPLENAASTR